jgi:hypothetical protein
MTEEVPLMSAPIRSRAVLGFAAGLLVACGVAATPAQARFFVGFGVPLVVAPPLYVPGPAWYPPYYPPSPAYSAPGNEFSYVPPQNQPRSLAAPGASDLAESCEAGPYVCPLVRETPAGAPCSCPGNYGRRVPGVAR